MLLSCDLYIFESGNHLIAVEGFIFFFWGGGEGAGGLVFLMSLPVIVVASITQATSKHTKNPPSRVLVTAKEQPEKRSIRLATCAGRFNSYRCLYLAIFAMGAYYIHLKYIIQLVIICVRVEQKNPSLGVAVITIPNGEHWDGFFCPIL